MSFVLAVLVLWPAIYLFILTLAALVARKQKLRISFPIEGHFAFVVPAHNEQDNIAQTIASLKKIQDHDFSIHIIADNCTDETARVAREHGAQVWERFDEHKRSKGYALEWAIPQITSSREVVAIAVIDADATLSENSVTLARYAFAYHADVLQSEYVLTDARGYKDTLISIGFAAMNVVRGLGRRCLKTSDTLKGNGMWFKTEVLTRHPWRAYSLAEDFEFSIYLISKGIRVETLLGSKVTGLPARSNSGLEAQRVRWESGRLALVMQEFFPALKRFLRKPSHVNFDILSELATPPLALLVVFYAIFFLFSVHLISFLIAVIGLSLLATHVILAIPIGGLPARSYFYLLLSPLYIAWKMALLPKIWFSRKSKTWVRAQRMLLIGVVGAASFTAARATQNLPLSFKNLKTFPANENIFCLGYGPWLELDDALKLNPTLVRWGGNTSTRFNLKQGNLWNAGHDYHFANIKKGDAHLLPLFSKTFSRGSFFTIPVLGWVAKDGETRGKVGALPTLTSVALKNEDVLDFVTNLKSKAPNVTRRYALDNEPFLWHETHRDLVSKKISASEFAKKWIEFAKLVRKADANAVITGPGLWGWKDLESLNEFLDETLTARDENNQPLLNVVSASLYPQNDDLKKALVDITGRETKTLSESPATEKRRVDSVQNFDSATYRDDSWIQQPINYLNEIQNRIQKSALRLKLKNRPLIGIAEYNWGAPYSRSGAAAQVLLLQTFLKNQNVDHACTFTWPPSDSEAGKAFLAINDLVHNTQIVMSSQLPDEALWIQKNKENFVLYVTKDTVSDPFLPSSKVKSIDILKNGSWQKTDEKQLKPFSIYRIRLAIVDVNQRRK